MEYSEFFAWVLLPVMIFLARIADQTIGTLRLIFLSKGFKLLAPALGFFEVIIWLVAVSQIMQHLDNVLCYVAYGAGFAMGNYLGITIDEKLSIGYVVIRIIPKFATDELISHLRGNDFGVTVINADGSRGTVKVLLTIMQRKRIPEAVEAINKFNPNAFYTIEEVRSINEGIMGAREPHRLFSSIAWKLKKAK